MNILSPITLGRYNLTNRIIMAPLTRMRAPNGLANDLMAEYYAQRATAGIIISEATAISAQGIGYPNIPCIYTPEHIDAWKKVTTAVHQHNGHIFLQLWHVGRISHPDFHQGELPVSPSAVTPKGQAVTFKGYKPFVTPRALTVPEIQNIVEDYRKAAENALAAGFDGVEIHAANGYLIDQFLRNGVNQREDDYGGSIENRTRFLLEVTEAVVSVCGADRVGVRLAPSGTFNDMTDTDPERLFTYALHQLNPFDLAYVHIVDALEGDIRHGAKVVELEKLREAYNGKLIVCGGYDYEKANHAIEANLADAVAFGQLYIANPDLVERFKQHAPLNTPNPSTFYGGNEKGYTDYSSL